MDENITPPPVPPPPPPPPLKKNPRTTRILFIVLISLGGLFALALAISVGYGFYLHHQYVTQEAARNAKLKEQQEKQVTLRKLFQLKIEAALKDSSTLPPCPLVFPLLNEKGMVTPLGSYLSYLAMEQASNLPHAALELANVRHAFNDFDLFETQKSSRSSYQKQLPYYFAAKDFADGTIQKKKNRYFITLHFRGAHPTHNYKRSFGQKDLNLSIDWIASCIHSHIGFKPDPLQTEHLAKPIFKDGDDLLHAAESEYFFNDLGSILVLHWDRILNKNPENPFLVFRKISILHAIDNAEHMDYAESMASKHPDDSIYHFYMIQKCNSSKKYGQGIDLGLAELKNDVHNSRWYEVVEDCLTSKDDWISAYQLLKTRTEKFPDDPRAWIELAHFMKSWAWEARGDGMANTVGPDAWKLFEKRIGEGYGYAKKSTEVAPGFWRTWDCVLNFGTGASLPQEVMEKYFQKLLSLNPTTPRPYFTYLNYLKPKWHGSVDEMMDFAQKYSKDFPNLMAVAHAENMGWDNNVMNQIPFTAECERAYQNSKDWAPCEKYVRLNLAKNPDDITSWELYFRDAELAGVLDGAVKFGNDLSHKDKRLIALPMALVKARQTAHVWNLRDNHEKSNYWNGPQKHKETIEVSLQMAKLDPENWYWLNRALCLQVHEAEIGDSIKTYHRIGKDHWDPDVCTAHDWELVQKWAADTSASAPVTGTSSK